MGNAPRPQVGLALLQLLYDLVAFHKGNYRAKGVKKHALLLHVISAQKKGF
jgi:hypothetical protein